jgi:hypothetical protein
MRNFHSELTRDAEDWVLRVKTPAGIELEYRYGSEAQARYFSAIFALGPTQLPVPRKVENFEVAPPPSVPKPARKRSRKAARSVLPVDEPLDALAEELVANPPDPRPQRRKRPVRAPELAGVSPSEINDALSALG